MKSVRLSGSSPIGSSGTVRICTFSSAAARKRGDAPSPAAGAGFPFDRWRITVDTHRNILHTGNLIEACTYGIEMFIHCDDPEAGALMENVELSDNMILNSGFGWGCQRPDKDMGTAIQLQNYRYDIKDMRFTNNVLYRGRIALLNGWGGNDTYPRLSGNTYVQDNFGRLAYWRSIEDGTTYYKQYLYNDLAADVVRDVLGDANAVVAPLSYPS